MIPQHSADSALRCRSCRRSCERDSLRRIEHYDCTCLALSCPISVSHILPSYQNPSVGWGSNFYLKGTLLHPKPSDDINMRKFQHLLDNVPYPDFTFMNVHEFWPHEKVNSVPADATPYRRNLPGNSLIVLRWETNTPENNAKAREIAHAIATFSPKAEGYGNYCEFRP